jgi:hypothetical protein
MLTFVISLAIMFTIVGSGVAWAKREDRRRMADDELDGIEEVLGRARHHR